VPHTLFNNVLDCFVRCLFIRIFHHGHHFTKDEKNEKITLLQTDRLTYLCRGCLATRDCFAYGIQLTYFPTNESPAAVTYWPRFRDCFHSTWMCSLATGECGIFKYHLLTPRIRYIFIGSVTAVTLSITVFVHNNHVTWLRAFVCFVYLRLPSLSRKMRHPAYSHPNHHHTCTYAHLFITHRVSVTTIFIILDIMVKFVAVNRQAASRI